MRRRIPTRTTHRSKPSRVNGILHAGVLGACVGIFAVVLGLPMLVSYWGGSAPVVAFGAGFGTLSGLVFGPRWGKRVVGTLLIALQLLWLFVVATPVAGRLAREVVRTDAIGARADAVYVFGSSLRPGGELTDVALSRLLHGIELVAEGRAPRLVLSELPAPADGYAVAARGLLGRLGLRQEVLAIGPVLRSRDEAVQLADLCRRRGWKRIVVVTSPLHTRRACAAVEREGLDVTCSPALETRFDLTGLAGAESKLAVFGHALHERVGLWYYRQRGWL